MTVIGAAAQLLDMIVKAEIAHDETVAEIRKRAERAEAQLAERDKPCMWHKNHASRDMRGLVLMVLYRTACNRTVFPPEQDFEYCPYCGHPIRVASSDNDLLPDNEPS